MGIVARFLAKSLLLWALISGAAHAYEQDFQVALRTLVTQFDRAQFELSPGEARLQALEAVLQQAVDLQKRYPIRAELLCWEGWVLIAQSETLEGLDILEKRSAAKSKLEAALAIDPTVYEGAPYISLGDLYYLGSLLPFPLFLGGKTEANDSYRKALELDPAGLAPNLHFANFLFATQDYAGALRHATAAANSRPLESRAEADKVLRKEANRLAANARQKMR